ncbi:MAG: multifunctional acyl-CoA thioesterase and protease and lysophospholipase [Myxococcaceae bacterium]|nr:multifunctional acyl-CoA thioesterase and protease and lysophospholipase [Myxococcaceae bacterium]
MNAMSRWVGRGLACALLAAGCAPTSESGTAVQAATVPRTVLPVIGASMKARLRAIYAAGQAAGNRANVFSKVGDDLTATGAFMDDLGCRDETLGTYASLLPTVDYFRTVTFAASRTGAWCGTANSYSLRSAAADQAWTAARVLTPYPTAPSDCPAPDNTPLRCELRRTRPGAALIMLGSYDLQASADPAAFRASLTQVVADVVNAGVIPVLSTIPPRRNNTTLGPRVAAYNDAIIAVAEAQQVPLWDYWVALNGATMLNQGMASDGLYPSVGGGSAANFTASALRYGYNQRNLTAVQVLGRVKAVVYDDGPPDTGEPSDAGTPADTGPLDSGPADTGPLDTGPRDTGPADTGPADAGPADTGSADTGSADAGAARGVVPVINASMKARLRSVFLAGQSAGNRAGVFAKVGDSITDTGSFLTDIGCGVETLGAYTSLAPTISFFRATSFPSNRTSGWCGVANSFSIDSVAAASGWTTADALGAVSRSECPSPFNTALRCELHRTLPASALIMLGTNDLERINNVTTYRANLTQIVTDAVNAGVIPVLSTIPARRDNATLGARVASYNDAIAAVAAAQQVPLWDYFAALSAPTVLNQGVSGDGIHPTIYTGSDGTNFTATALRYGYNQRNLTAVQVLQHLKAVVFDDGPADP